MLPYRERHVVPGCSAGNLLGSVVKDCRFEVEGFDIQVFGNCSGFEVVALAQIGKRP